VTVDPGDGLVRFGVFELDTKAVQLSKNGIRVRLSPQSLQVLSVLVERPGEVVSRKDLHKLLWSSDVFVDFDHGLNKSIQKLRDALGDSPESPRYIETIPRTGYRFIAPVTETSKNRPSAHAEGPARTPEPTANPSVGRDRKPKGRWLALGSCAAIVVLAGGLALLRYKAAEPIRSLAVLPLENLSGDPAQEYFVDGMSDELITMLAKNSTLRIVSRTSVMQYKGARRPLREIARALGVDGILEGSISRTGSQVHLTLQLIRADTDAHLWAESYDRTGNDVAALPGEAARDVATRLHSSVDSSSPARAVSPEAHDAYLRGWYFLDKREADKSAAYFQRAISIDPSWSQAYSGFAEAVQHEGILGMMPRNDAMVKTEAAARRAIELDPQNGQAYSALGIAQGLFEWNWADAEENLKRGVALSPSNSNADRDAGGRCRLASATAKTYPDNHRRSPRLGNVLLRRGWECRRRWRRCRRRWRRGWWRRRWRYPIRDLHADRRRNCRSVVAFVPSLPYGQVRNCCSSNVRAIHSRSVCRLRG
jgi:TolB-like protein/DNA-binding winged helix-turn-helix (wHTH) protein